MATELDTVHAHAEPSVDTDAERISVTQTIRCHERAQAPGTAGSSFHAAVFAESDTLGEWEQHIDDDLSVRVSRNDRRKE